MEPDQTCFGPPSGRDPKSELKSDIFRKPFLEGSTEIPQGLCLPLSSSLIISDMNDTTFVLSFWKHALWLKKFC